MKNAKKPNVSDDNALEKIKSLQEMIANAERTISSAKQMLTQLQGPVAPAQPLKAPMVTNEGQVIHGHFDGQIMIGEDGKQYPVPANYASKSKLVEGDMLKLTITNDGNFVYKQIGPVERKYLIGLVEQDERGNYVIVADEKRYKVLLAAATYFKIELGDEVTLIVPRATDSVWGAVENVLRKANDVVAPPATASWEKPADFAVEDEAEEEKSETPSKPSAIEKLEKEIEQERRREMLNKDILDEWEPDLEALKKEASHPVGRKNEDEF